MQDLRLVGVHDDGKHLLLSGAGGEMFQLPIDEALRVAASRTAAKSAAAAVAAPIAMSPRDIQARIRSGSTAAEVAELSGIPVAKVQRYEGPVLAEREHVARQAQKVEVAAPAPGHDIYRSVFGDRPASLGEMVAHRLSAHGINASTVEWDSWRRPDGNWNVVARFEAQPGGPAGIGEEPPAMWTFSPARKSLQNANRWAQQLSELEPLDGPLPARRLSAVSDDRPFDFETDADAAARTATAQLQIVQQEQESDGLLDMLRSRRGQRLGVDEDGDDALAKLLTDAVPAAHPRPAEILAELPADTVPEESTAETAEPESEETADIEPRPAANPWDRRRDGRPSIMSRLSLAPRQQESEDDALKLHDGVSTDTREITIAASQMRPSGKQEPTPRQEAKPRRETPGGRIPASSPGLDELLGGGSARRQPREAPAGSPDDRGAEQPERQPAKQKRSSIPSWDDIVFGARGD
ncbi:MULTISPECIES: septation protein SepH [unclassified Arthrobacter]|uniref:septation protein SepH n=1 Tax=unclassified Arthrobacter TaxID=235627 RepID=UPI002DFC6054|nr:MULTISPECIES: septation protein SepH [unclassified Arthrobacter]MEC5192474.1 hypothetical protein [Arthrobacter sp. MP_M4]MEC5203958.1 hypothetical protein [Arthrobacter sp. MP_M7]